MTRRLPARGPSAVSGAITLVMFLQAPGAVAPDTKLDLAVDPVRFMSRALRLWDPQAAFGHLQNQAVGYLFPTAPFFALGQLAHLPMWAVQRAWMAAILVTALWGALRVAEELEIGTPTTRLLGASAYALSPVFLSQIAYTSAGQLPGALMPWALWALIRGARGGSPRRWAAASGIAVAAMGAVNATATLGGLVLPALFLVTRARGPRRAALVRWWLVALVLATVWWMAPLLLQGSYGYNFLGYTESATVTGASTSAFEVVRGTGYWLSYLVTDGAWLPAGWTLATLPIAIAATGALAAGGLVGLARPDMPERRLLVIATGLGTAVVAAGYAGALSGPLSGPVRELLTGALAPLRNLHKFEPVLRLPLALGLCHAVAAVRLPRVRPQSLVIGIAVTVAVAAAPALRDELVVTGSFDRIPTYWKQTARWLDARSEHGRSLVVPSAAFGEYRWGRPLDEPLQPLAQSPWALRDLVPLGSDGATRLLDGIGQRLDRAEASPGLATTLARAGVRFLVVRNDLDLIRTDAPPPAQMRRALAQVPGLRLVHRLGPRLTSGLSTNRLAPDMTAGDFRAVEIYEVAGAPGPVRVDDADAPVVMAGAPEGLVPLAGAGLADGPVLLADEEPITTVVTDVWRRRDVDFGAVRDNYSYVLTEREPAPATGDAPLEHVASAIEYNRSAASMRGAARLVDSSGATHRRLPEHQPYAAFDREVASAWIAPSTRAAVGAWIEVGLPHPIVPGPLTVISLRDRRTRPVATRVTVTTDAGSRTTTLAVGEARQRVAVAPGRTGRVRLTIDAVGHGRGRSGAGFREIEIGGLRVERTLAVPPVRTPSAATHLFERSRSDPYDLGRTDEEVRLRRRMTTGTGAQFTIAATASGRPGAALDRLVEAHRGAMPVRTTSSSTWRRLPAFAAAHALDGDPATAWLADPEDTLPSISITWPEPRTVTELRVRRAPGPTRVPTRVRLTAGGEVRDVRLDRGGTGRFAAIRADAVEVRVTATTPTSTARIGTSPLVRAAVGAAEIQLGPAPNGATATAEVQVRLPCGSGPPVLVDGVAHATSAEGTLGDLVALRPLRVTGCGEIELVQGEHTVEGGDEGPLVIDTLVIEPIRARAAPPPARAVRILTWRSEERRVSLASGDAAFLAVAENFNRGWEAKLNGRLLEPVPLDGWKQGWRVPAGAGGIVRLRFTPGTLYRGGLIIGATGLVLLLVLLLVRGRPQDEPAASPAGSVDTRLAWAMSLVVLGSLGGVAGLAVGAVALMVRGRTVLAGVAALAATAMATTGAWVGPVVDAGSFSPGVQALTLLALAAVVVPRRDP